MSAPELYIDDGYGDNAAAAAGRDGDDDDDDSDVSCDGVS